MLFRLPLAVALERILEGRPQLKYFEAGMDLDLSPDPTESFRIFQGRVLAEYLRLVDEFGFTVVDATQPVHRQQTSVRRLIQDRVDLGFFHKRYIQ
jgi:dTMP kinase